MRITMNTGTTHELYNCHMRACMLFTFPDAMVEVQHMGEVPEVWLCMKDDSEFSNFFKPHCVKAAIKAFNKAEACNPYAVEALGNRSGAMQR